jgi:predicted nucleic acid-binding protein
MYAVVEYNNYTKDLCLSILHVYNNLEKAIHKAKLYAEKQSEEDCLEITDNIDKNYLDLTDCIEYFTTGTGWGRNIYAVLVLPSIEDNNKNQDE